MHPVQWHVTSSPGLDPSMGTHASLPILEHCIDIHLLVILCRLVLSLPIGMPVYLKAQVI